MKRERKIRYDEYGNPIPPNKARTVFYAVMIGLSVLVYLVIFWRFYEARDSGLSEQILLDAFSQRKMAAATLCVKLPGERDFFLPSSTEKPTVLCYSPTTTMDSDGRLQVRNILYLKNAGNLQLTLKVNTRYYPLKRGTGYRFVLKILDAEGNVRYAEKHFEKCDYHGTYTFIRMGFSGLVLSETDTVRLRVLPEGAENDSSGYLNLKLCGTDVYSYETDYFDRERVLCD